MVQNNYLKDKGFGKIFARYFVLLFVCLVLPVTIINIWFGYTSKKSIKEELIKINELELEQAYKGINSVVQAVKENAYDLSNHSIVQYLAVLNSSKQDQTGNAELLVELLKTTKRMNNYIENISIYFEKSQEVFRSDEGIIRGEYSEREWLKVNRDKLARVTFQARKENGRYPYLLTVVYPINPRKNDDDGLIVIDINVKSLASYLGRGRYQSKNDESVLIVMDSMMETLIYSDEYQLYEREQEIIENISAVRADIYDNSQIHTFWDETYILSGYFAEQEQFMYINLKTMDAYTISEENLNVNTRNIIIVTGGLCILLAFLLASWVYKPIRKTMQLLEELSLLSGWEENKYFDEVTIIQKSILGVKTKYDNLNDQMKERAIHLQSAQMCALQAQINPHFLYNTLMSIGNAAALLMGSSKNKITEMICSLGQLMRISLKGESYLVSLEEELEQVMLYTKLLDFRFRNRIRLHIEIPEEMIQEKILKLTLQPLVENAVDHGFKDKRANGQIWIKGEVKGNIRCIHVMDNGRGISEEEYEKLQLQISESAIIGNRHLGLRNVNQRLKLIYGEGYGLSISKPSDTGFCVTICYTLLE